LFTESLYKISIIFAVMLIFMKTAFLLFIATCHTRSSFFFAIISWFFWGHLYSFWWHF